MAYKTELLEVRSAGRKGRGVFARQYLPKGTVIEVSPIIYISKGDYRKLKRTCLDNYFFDAGYGAVAIGLGVSSLFNHGGPESNATYSVYRRKKIVKIWLTKNAHLGDEIVVDYGYDPKDYK